MNSNGTLSEFSETQHIKSLLGEISSQSVKPQSPSQAPSAAEPLPQSDSVGAFLTNLNWANAPLPEPTPTKSPVESTPTTPGDSLGAQPLNQFLANVNWANEDRPESTESEQPTKDNTFSIESVFSDIQWD